ncbi:hypothetical protein QTP88_008854 [Uroleucon formosanum]
MNYRGCSLLPPSPTSLLILSECQPYLFVLATGSEGFSISHSAAVIICDAQGCGDLILFAGKCSVCFYTNYKITISDETHNELFILKLLAPISQFFKTLIINDKQSF